MNWLAHLRLAPDAPLVRLGNLAGDFVRGVDISTPHPELQLGVAQHRGIDRFVDAHPVVRASRDRFSAEHRRFAGIFVDVFMDHFVARDWHAYGDGRPLAAFAAEIHDDLLRHEALLPPRLREAIPWMRRQQWLTSYAEVAGIDAVLRRMAARASRPTPLAEGADVLRAHYDAFAADVRVLWPELVAFAASVAR